MEPLRANDPARISGYRLAGRLGTGGMGVVYLGRAADGQEVAIKVIRHELIDEPEFLARFRDEVAAMMRISGRHTVPVIGADPDGDPAWLATAYVPAPTLAEVVAERGPLHEGEVLKLATGLAEALRTIHAADLIHRDLKPGNILLAVDGPKVIDFGIALTAGKAGHTRTGMVIGTHAYMAPERLEGEPAGPASDVYSLGAVLAFAALGRPPHGDSDSVESLRMRVLSQEPDLGGIGGELRELIRSCLAKDPGQRPTPERLLAGDGAGATEVLEPKKPAPTKVQKSAKRGKTGKALASWLLVLVVAAGIAAVVWHYVGKPGTLYTKEDAAKHLRRSASTLTESQGKPPQGKDSSDYGSYTWRPIGTDGPDASYHYTRSKTSSEAEKEIEVGKGDSLVQLPNGSNTVTSVVERGCRLQLQNGDLFITVTLDGAKISMCEDAARVIDDRLGRYL